MQNIDLDIDNYNYQDLLNLFKLNYDFNKTQLKIVKQTVLATHPDKSNLDKKYFLFFSKAYKVLLSVYEFREKATNSENLTLPKEEIDYLANKDEYNEKIIENLREKNKFTNNQFNKWFNKMFESIKLNNEYNDEGYGEWLKKCQPECDNKCKNQTEINKKIQERKTNFERKSID